MNIFCHSILTSSSLTDAQVNNIANLLLHFLHLSRPRDATNPWWTEQEYIFAEIHCNLMRNFAPLISLIGQMYPGDVKFKAEKIEAGQRDEKSRWQSSKARKKRLASNDESGCTTPCVLTPPPPTQKTNHTHNYTHTDTHTHLHIHI